MARLFLVNPPTDELVRTPLLSFLYLASALRRAGHEVAVLDASAPFAPRGHDEVVERALSFRAEAVGIHCKTLYAQDAYALAASFAGRGVQLVCGGPHPTVAPLEPLAHGFDFSVRGEGEETLAELCDAFDGRRPLGSVDPRAAAALTDHFPSAWSLAEVKRAYADDAALERNYFRLSAAHLELIYEGLRRKTDATYRKIAAASASAPGWEPRRPAEIAIPAAGSR
jgi:radical SAM superfamily enzyme YgiQ (UPF0313 family)